MRERRKTYEKPKFKTVRALARTLRARNRAATLPAEKHAGGGAGRFRRATGMGLLRRGGSDGNGISDVVRHAARPELHHHRRRHVRKDVANNVDGTGQPTPG